MRKAERTGRQLNFLSPGCGAGKWESGGGWMRASRVEADSYARISLGNPAGSDEAVMSDREANLNTECNIDAPRVVTGNDAHSPGQRFLRRCHDLVRHCF